MPLLDPVHPFLPPHHHHTPCARQTSTYSHLIYLFYQHYPLCPPPLCSRQPTGLSRSPPLAVCGPVPRDEAGLRGHYLSPDLLCRCDFVFDGLHSLFQGELGPLAYLRLRSRHLRSTCLEMMQIPPLPWVPILPLHSPLTGLPLFGLLFIFPSVGKLLHSEPQGGLVTAPFPRFWWGGYGGLHRNAPASGWNRGYTT